MPETEKRGTYVLSKVKLFSHFWNWNYGLQTEVHIWANSPKSLVTTASFPAKKKKILAEKGT